MQEKMLTIVLSLIFLFSLQSAFAQTGLIKRLTATQSEPKTDWYYYQKGGHRSPKWDSLVEAGLESFASGNLETAVNFFKRAMGLGCQDGLVLFKLATHQELQGNLKEAVRLLKEAKPLLRNRYAGHPATKEISEQMGRLFYQQEKYSEALPEFLEAIQTQGDNFLRLYLVGQLYRMKKENKEAIAYFEKSLQVEAPAQIAGMKQLAQIELMKLYFDSKNDDKTLEMASLILAQDPQNPTALSYRDQILHRRYRAKEREILQKTIEQH